MNNPEFTDAEYREAAALWDAIDRGRCVPSHIARERLRVYHLITSKERLRKRRIAAARKAIGLLNKKSLRNWPRLGEHRSRVFRNLNKLRAV